MSCVALAARIVAVAVLVIVPLAAVTVWLPDVFRVTVNRCVPASPAVKV